MHQLEYDGLGRQVEDRVTSLGPDVDDAVRRIATEYTDRGQVSTITSYDHADVYFGSVLNQVRRDYDGFGRLITEYQQVGWVEPSETHQISRRV